MYAQRDKGGAVAGLVRWEHGDFPEMIAEDHPDVVAFLNPPEPPAQPTVEDAIEALDEYVTSGKRTKLDELKARLFAV